MRRLINIKAFIFHEYLMFPTDVPADDQILFLSGGFY